MKKTTFSAIIAIVLMCSLWLTSCSTNEQKPSQEEMQELFAQAQEYEENAKFKDAIKIYRQLNEYGFDDPDFGSDSASIREERYIRQSIACKYFSRTVETLKKQLKDPYSLVVYSMTIDHNSPSGEIRIKFDYGAKNGFGGMVREGYTKTYRLDESEKEKVYQTSKEFMDSRGMTKDDVGSFLSSNCYIYDTTQYDAIVAGTYNY